ncbi:MAG: type II toxin-antitoxin system HicB family antitoxin [Pseudomonadota bacterium]
MRYPLTIVPDTTGYLVTFADIPEAITAGDTLQEALSMAHDALFTALEFYFDDKRPVPMPSTPVKGQDFIELPASLSAKILLLNTMLEQKLRPVDLARLLKTSPQSVNRLTDLRHVTRIDSVAEALLAMGKRLDVVLR